MDRTFWDKRYDQKDFENFDFIELLEENIHLNEGDHHVGIASVIRVFAIKK
ncbi:hypothetical protein ACFOUP_10690 [Belliella kenyensis]|uniref:SAM-dependent methyltransferase n=1 Tax=Belliella kenyensis TaxID=1472724 RepID=A0ABV8EKK2_9BACT|nr:hypothetical protein [Belliella kenyensis]MCH7400463.1 hypothetical protein [Belliella kenyensis]MDN3604521.1 hypothetical protein [Belliella kenyensis]